MRKTGTLDGAGYPTMAFKEGDEGEFSPEDIVKKLPPPVPVGGSSRRQHLLSFPLRLTYWNVEYFPFAIRNLN